MTTAYETACLNHDHATVASAKYSSDFKREAVVLAKGSQGPAAAASALGLELQTLLSWMALDAGSPLMTSGADTTSPDQAEIERLKGELTMDKMERDVIEKTTEFFDKARQ
jgi:transposase